MNTTLNLLRIDASARTEGSVSRDLGDRLIARLGADRPVHVTTRDVGQGIPFVTADWVAANFTDPDTRSDAQRETLAFSDALVAELQAADAIVITTPMYNFGIPATLKAWIDQVARARLTFRYTETGPVGLLPNQPVYLVVATGGTAVAGALDFATGYLRHVLGFIGLHDVRVIAADRLMSDADAAIVRATEALDEAVSQPSPSGAASG